MVEQMKTLGRFGVTHRATYEVPPSLLVRSGSKNEMAAESLCCASSNFTDYDV
jgi:hypothetical protein